MTQATEEKAQKLNELIGKFHVAMLTTLDADGTLHSRPMATLNRKYDGSLYFFTAAGSHKTEEIEGHTKVNLSYADIGSNLFVSIVGTASLVRDRKMIRDLWNPAMQTWFPKGPDDQDIALLKVDVEKAEYWDAPGMASPKQLL